VGIQILGTMEKEGICSRSRSSRSSRSRKRNLEGGEVSWAIGTLVQLHQLSPLSSVPWLQRGDFHGPFEEVDAGSLVQAWLLELTSEKKRKGGRPKTNKQTNKQTLEEGDIHSKKIKSEQGRGERRRRRRGGWGLVGED